MKVHRGSLIMAAAGAGQCYWALAYIYVSTIRIMTNINMDAYWGHGFSMRGYLQFHLLDIIVTWLFLTALFFNGLSFLAIVVRIPRSEDRQLPAVQIVLRATTWLWLLMGVSQIARAVIAGMMMDGEMLLFPALGMLAGLATAVVAQTPAIWSVGSRDLAYRPAARLQIRTWVVAVTGLTWIALGVLFAWTTRLTTSTLMTPKRAPLEGILESTAWVLLAPMCVLGGVGFLMLAGRIRKMGLPQSKRYS